MVRKNEMRVLHILDELKFSGAEIMYVAAAKLFQDLGCELYVVNTANHLGEYTPFFKEAGYTVLHPVGTRVCFPSLTSSRNRG